MSNAWFENYKRRMSAERAASPSMSSVASATLNGDANNSLAALNKRRNAVYTRKANQWKTNVAAGKVNVSPRPAHRNQNKLTRNEFRRRLMEESRPPVEPVFTNVAQWRPLAAANNDAKAQKQADMAAYFAAMKSKKPAKNVRHTTGRALRKNRKTRRTSLY